MKREGAFAPSAEVEMDIGLSMMNMGEYLRVMIIDLEKEDAIDIEITNTIADMKRFTHADVFEINTIVINGYAFKCVFGAKVNESARISAFDSKGSCILRGSIIIFGLGRNDDKEILRSLTDAELELLKNNLFLCTIADGCGTIYNTYALRNISSNI